MSAELETKKKCCARLAPTKPPFIADSLGCRGNQMERNVSGLEACCGCLYTNNEVSINVCMFSKTFLCLQRSRSGSRFAQRFVFALDYYRTLIDVGISDTIAEIRNYGE